MLATALCCTAASSTDAQEATALVTVQVLSHEGAVTAARVSAGTISAITNTMGQVTLRLSAGEHVIRAVKDGHPMAELTITVRSAADTSVVIHLDGRIVEHESIIVSSTRTDRRIEDEPVRVEVIGREEIEEKLLMTPGDIAMLLNETAGLRVQPAASALGGASVRVQGLRGRYTQVLSDGLPLYGGQTGVLGVLQIPPMDLGQVEVIKGVASALYGASALGGVVNLISRRPAGEADRELLFNQSTLGGTDAIGWASDQVNEQWGYTFLGSVHRQSQSDVDGDGWADLASYRRAVGRPRIFWNDGRRSTVLVTLGAMAEDRSGGTASGGVTPDGTPFVEAIDTRRADGGVLARFMLNGSRLLSIRGSASRQQHHHVFDDVRESDTHVTAFAEAALSGTSGAHTWLVGAAMQRERYAADTVPTFDYTHTVPALFAQDEFAPAAWLTLALSGRLDWHSEYGMFFSPRASALMRPARRWSVRASAGTGFFAPTPWTEETESLGLSRVVPNTLVAERARGASIDVGHTLGPVELNATVFASRIDQPVQARPAPDDPARIQLFNAGESVRTTGTEILARYHRAPIHVTATHVFIRSTEPEPGGPGRREVPLTPRHAAGIVAALEHEDDGRIGVELYYTGLQQLHDNPYRSESEPHVIVGFLGERRIGRARFFLNAENLLDARQTRYDPLVLPARSPEGRWVTDVWAPLDGRSFNAGVRIDF